MRVPQERPARTTQQAAFEPGFPFDKTNLTVAIEGASALQYDTYNLDIDAAPSQYRAATLTLTDDGLKSPPTAIRDGGPAG